MKPVLLVALALLVISGIAVVLVFSRDIQAAKNRVTGRSSVNESSFWQLIRS